MVEYHLTIITLKLLTFRRQIFSSIKKPECFETITMHYDECLFYFDHRILAFHFVFDILYGHFKNTIAFEKHYLARLNIFCI